ncbi:MAG: hypothetical protein AAF657_37920 [Acidobacteriota bacterium]
MSEDDRNALDQEIRALLGASDVGQHPSHDELAAYVRGDLPAAAAERLQEHLGPCRQCTATVLALDLPELEDFEVEALPAAEIVAEVDTIVARTRAEAEPAARRPLLALAAMLAIACLALGIFVVHQQQQLEELEDALLRVAETTSVAQADPAEGPPQTGVPIVDLYPSSVARGEVSVASVAIPGQAAMVVLILTPPSDLSFESYVLRLFDAADRELWRGPARANAAGSFVVVLPRRFAEASPERIVLYGLEGAVERQVEVYRVRFEL